MSQSESANRCSVLPLKLREKLYRAFIAPHFNYCAEYEKNDMSKPFKGFQPLSGNKKAN